MQFLIVTGQSGAGKSRVAAILEDIGFYCVDNLPPELISQFGEVCLASSGRYDRVALVSDVRAGQNFEGLLNSLRSLDQMGLKYSIVYVEADGETLLQRYKESRRSHPLERGGISLPDAIAKEQQLLVPVKEKANYLIDTTHLSIAQLRKEIIRLFEGDTPKQAMVVNVVSFGFKYGLPVDADLVFDVRFLPNPFYIAELRPKTGLTQEVRDFILSYQQSKDYIQKLEDLLSFCLPLYFDEGKTSLVIAVGCTGGRHRSVMIARELSEFVSRCGYPVLLRHRDIARG